MTSAMVLWSHIRESRSSAEKPEPESRPNVVFRPEMQLMAEIPPPISVREGFGTARPDSVADAMPVDKPEVVPTFPLPARQEIPPETSQINQNLLSTVYWYGTLSA